MRVRGEDTFSKVSSAEGCFDLWVLRILQSLGGIISSVDPVYNFIGFVHLTTVDTFVQSATLNSKIVNKKKILFLPSYSLPSNEGDGL